MDWVEGPDVVKPRNWKGVIFEVGGKPREEGSGTKYFMKEEIPSQHEKDTKTISSTTIG